MIEDRNAGAGDVAGGLEIGFVVTGEVDDVVLGRVVEVVALVVEVDDVDEVTRSRAVVVELDVASFASLPQATASSNTAARQARRTA